MAQRHDENYNEQPMTRMGRIQQPSRRYRRLRHPSFTAAIWTVNNPLLQRGEIGGEIDTHRIKMGDGVTYWNDLPYASDSIATWGDIQGNISDQTDLQDALDAKANVADLATVATSGAFSDLTGKPTTLSGYGITDGANTSLSNLTSAGANISKWSSNVSNCITEIPQDINLELNNGTLTLKAGSKVHMADGNLEVTTTTSADITKTSPYNGQYMIILYGNAIFSGFVDSCLSGTIANRPNSTAHIAGMYFATDENKIYVTSDAGATWVHAANMSMPLAIITVSSGAISSIDQVFNGFGYIGSTVFALPGVKGLIPNGRNADGTLKSSSFTINNVLTTTDTSGATGALEYYINGSGIFRANLGTNTYDETKNIFVNASGVQQMIIALDTAAYRTGGQVTSLKPKTTFRAFDYNDTNFIGHQAMPSKRYINLSLGTSGSNVTMPADGYLTISKAATASGQYVNFVNNTNGANVNSIAAGAMNCRLMMPVSKSDVVTVNYTVASTTNMFRFVYANGAK